MIIKVYSSPEEDEPDYIIHKDGLVYKFNTIVSGNEFISYADYNNNVGYLYYGINRNHYYKFDNEDPIEEIIEYFVEDFNVNYSDVKFEKGEYISSIPYEGKVKYGHYVFNDGRLNQLNIYFEDELYFKTTISYEDPKIELPSVNYIDEMSTLEMKVYIIEALKELKSYTAIDANYTVEAYEHYTVANFKYLRIKNSDDSYKSLEQLLSDIKDLIIDHYFANRVDIIGQVESLDEYMWLGKFSDGNQNGLVIKIDPDSTYTNVTFAVVEYDVLNIIALKEYLENRLVDDPEEDCFTFDGTIMIDTKDCFLIQYYTTMNGEFDNLVEYASTCIGDNGYEWAASGSSDDYHYDILEFENKAVRVHFSNYYDGSYLIKITFCVSFTDEEPSSILEFGIDSPLFE